MTETTIFDFKNHGYYELVDVEDSWICGRMGKENGQSLQLVANKT